MNVEKIKKSALIALKVASILVGAIGYMLVWGKILLLLAPLIEGFVVLIAIFLIAFHIIFISQVID